MSTTGDDVERIALADLPFEEAVEVVKAAFGYGDLMASTFVAMDRGEIGEGVVQESTEEDG